MIFSLDLSPQYSFLFTNHASIVLLKIPKPLARSQSTMLRGNFVSVLSCASALFSLFRLLTRKPGIYFHLARVHLSPPLLSPSQVMCWDLEYNRVVRHYHGHLSGVHCLALHPMLDVLVTGGRDSVARVWDMRTKKQIHALAGHTNAVGTVATNAVDPQVRCCHCYCCRCCCCCPCCPACCLRNPYREDMYGVYHQG